LPFGMTKSAASACSPLDLVDAEGLSRQRAGAEDQGHEEASATLKGRKGDSLYTETSQARATERVPLRDRYGPCAPWLEWCPFRRAR
jgi:hypothetical protein